MFPHAGDRAIFERAEHRSQVRKPQTLRHRRRVDDIHKPNGEPERFNAVERTAERSARCDEMVTEHLVDECHHERYQVCSRRVRARDRERVFAFGDDGCLDVDEEGGHDRLGDPLGSRPEHARELDDRVTSEHALGGRERGEQIRLSFREAARARFGIGEPGGPVDPQHEIFGKPGSRDCFIEREQDASRSELENRCEPRELVAELGEILLRRAEPGQVFE